MAKSPRDLPISTPKCCVSGHEASHLAFMCVVQVQTQVLLLCTTSSLTTKAFPQTKAPIFIYIYIWLLSLLCTLILLLDLKMTGIVFKRISMYFIAQVVRLDFEDHFSS